MRYRGLGTRSYLVLLITVVGLAICLMVLRPVWLSWPTARNLSINQRLPQPSYIYKPQPPSVAVQGFLISLRRELEVFLSKNATATSIRSIAYTKSSDTCEVVIVFPTVDSADNSTNHPIADEEHRQTLKFQRHNGSGYDANCFLPSRHMAEAAPESQQRLFHLHFDDQAFKLEVVEAPETTPEAAPLDAAT